MQEDEGLDCLSKTKRSCVPKCIKRMTSGPKKGLEIGPFLLAQTIVLPLILVGADMVTDGDMLGQMWPYAVFSGSGNQVELNSTAGANISRSDEVAVDDDEGIILGFLFLVSIIILLLSILNMCRSNPLASLVRNARTTVMMNSRELERKDVPVPLGNK